MKKGVTLLSLLTLLSFNFYFWRDGQHSHYRSPASSTLSATENPIGNEAIYYIVIDRFFDGDTKNNIPDYAYPLTGNISKERFAFNKSNQYWLKKMYDKTKTNPRLYHGGDILGVIKKLDYLKDLGITTILLSPIVENVNGLLYYKAEGDYAKSAPADTPYHGYWAKDFFRLEEHFASPLEKNEKLSETLSGEKLISYLTEQAHARGIKVMLDLAFNQTSPIRPEEKIIPKKGGNYFLEHGPLSRNGRKINHYCYPTLEKTCNETLDDSGWYNESCLIEDWSDAKQVEKCQLYYLADLNQNKDEVAEYLIDSAKKWLDLGVDGFRMDAIKHISRKFLKDFETTIKEYKPSTILIGEYYDGGIHNKDSVAWLQSVDHYTMFDFTFSRSVSRFFTGNTEWIGNPFSIGWNIEKADGVHHSKNPLQKRSDNLITFLNNHDLPRFLSLPGANKSNYKAALALLLTSRGVPKLIYGDEIGFAVPYDKRYSSLLGIGGDHYARLSMNWNFSSSEKEIHSLTKKLLKYRKANPILRYGDTKLIAPTNISAKTKNFIQGYTYFAVERSHKKSKKLFYYFYSNIAQKMTFKTQLSDGHYVDLLSGKEIPVISGELNLSFKPHDIFLIGN